MTWFSDLTTPWSLATVKGTIAGYAAAGKLYLTSWQTGDPGEQLYQAFAKTVQAVTRTVTTAIRGMFLSTAEDPGDFDGADPAPGQLSWLGENMYGTTRAGSTFANGLVTFHNTGAVARVMIVGNVTVQNATTTQTYRNTDDGVHYTGPGGSYSLAPGVSIDLPVQADLIGTIGNAAAGEISIQQNLVGVTVTNAAALLGTDRESRDNYIARCETQAAAASPNGAADAYRRFATTNPDGTPLLNASGGAVGITRIYVSESSATGIVNVYFADDDGPADAGDVTAANANITTYVVRDTETYSGLTAISTTVVVTWVVKFRNSGPYTGLVSADVKAVIVAALTARFKEYEIGGFDQTAGVGSITQEEIRGTVKGAHPAIYSATVSAPSGTTAIALGHVPVLTTPTGTETGTAT